MDEKQSSSSCFGCLKSTFCCTVDKDVNISERKPSTGDKEKKVIKTAPVSKPTVVETSKQDDNKTAAKIETKPAALESQSSSKQGVTPKNDDEVPEWLNSAFIEATLQSKEPGISVISMDIEAAVPSGENYSCIVHRIKVKTSHGPRALIMKCIPSSEFRAKLMKEPMVRENEMYKNTLPFLKGDFDKPNVPQFYSVPDKKLKHETLILSDMKQPGYKLYDRRIGLDELHCQIVLTEVAYHHAHSIALRAKHPSTFESKILSKYPDVLYNEQNREMMTSFLKTTFSSITEMVRNKFPYRFKLISQGMDLIFNDKFYDVLHELNSVPTSKEELDKSVITLLHGDLWSSNIMFQYSGKDEPISCALLDFQAPRCASPVIDLLQFFFASTTKETRREHLDSLLQHYLAQVLAVLHKKGVNDPGTMFYSSLSEIKRDMRDKAVYGLFVACTLMPLTLVDASQAPSIDDYTEEQFQNLAQNPFIHLINNPVFCERFKGVLEDMDDMGIFKKELLQTK